MTKLSDALLALAEPLEESNQWGLRSHTKITPMGEGEIRKLIASLRALAAQAKELERDAERYRWLRSQPMRDGHALVELGIMYSNEDGPTGDYYAYDDAQLDAAIDFEIGND